MSRTSLCSNADLPPPSDRRVPRPNRGDGWYALADHPSGVLLETSMEIFVDLPLPRAAGGAVRTTMRGVINQMGDRFSKNLLQHLGV